MRVNRRRKRVDVGKSAEPQSQPTKLPGGGWTLARVPGVRIGWTLKSIFGRANNYALWPTD